MFDPKCRPAPTPQMTSPPAPPTGEPMKAIYDFEGQQATDLRLSGNNGNLYPSVGLFSFKAGDTIYVTAKNGEWWSGQLESGEKGDFPASFIDQGDAPEV